MYLMSVYVVQRIASDGWDNDDPPHLKLDKRSYICLPHMWGMLGEGQPTEANPPKAIRRGTISVCTVQRTASEVLSILGWNERPALYAACFKE
jgi:hypothetical protein